jgi:hypothetical protein
VPKRVRVINSRPRGLSFNYFTAVPPSDPLQLNPRSERRALAGNAPSVNATRYSRLEQRAARQTTIGFRPLPSASTAGLSRIGQAAAEGPSPSWSLTNSNINTPYFFGLSPFLLEYICDLSLTEAPDPPPTQTRSSGFTSAASTLPINVVSSRIARTLQTTFIYALDSPLSKRPLRESP